MSALESKGMVGLSAALLRGREVGEIEVEESDTVTAATKSNRARVTTHGELTDGCFSCGASRMCDTAR